MHTTQWLEIEPVDTLFFRGAEAMEAGENHEVGTMFPPMPSTIIGAIRTAVMIQRDIAPGKPESWKTAAPILGIPKTPCFTLIGPLFMIGETLLLPVPAHWYADLPEEKRMKWGKVYQVQAASPLEECDLGLTGSVERPPWVKNPIGADLKPLNGFWASSAVFAEMAKSGARIRFINTVKDLITGNAAILPISVLFDREERVGIALDRTRTARDGHLYSAAHVRLREGVRLVAGIASAHELPLDQEGIFQLGGEQRVCRYRFHAPINMPTIAESRTVYTTSPMPLSDLPEELAAASRASGKLLRVGGWDMQNGFHKTMRAWLPAGSVFFTDHKIEQPQLLHI